MDSQLRLHLQVTSVSCVCKETRDLELKRLVRPCQGWDTHIILLIYLHILILICVHTFTYAYTHIHTCTHALTHTHTLN